MGIGELVTEYTSIYINCHLYHLTHILFYNYLRLRWTTIAQYFPRRSTTAIRCRWRFITEKKSSYDDDKNTKESVKERAATLLNFNPASKLLPEGYTDTQGLSNHSIPVEKAVGKPGIKKSSLSNREMDDWCTLLEAHTDDISLPSVNGVVDSPPIQTQFTLDLSEEDIDAFLEWDRRTA